MNTANDFPLSQDSLTIYEQPVSRPLSAIAKKMRIARGRSQPIRQSRTWTRHQTGADWAVAGVLLVKHHASEDLRKEAIARHNEVADMPESSLFGRHVL